MIEKGLPLLSAFRNRIANFLRFELAKMGSRDFVKKLRTARRKQRLSSFLFALRKIEFPAATTPRVSFIIPVYNSAYHTLPCLLSILGFVDCEYEVIVVDDGSTDETSELLARFKNLRVHRNQKNVGFLTSVNEGAKLARGQYAIFLNNDARLISGSISTALDTFAEQKNCGLMGARIRHINGSLQEAGCIVYQDGTTNGYLRFQSVNDPRGLFQRDVDYCSGVFAIVTRRQFLELGGFDKAYAPAYFEETDFCMRLREENLRVIYNPRLLVEHFEFGSGGNSIAARQEIEARRKIFLSRWQKTLKNQKFFPTESSEIIEAAAMRLLPHRRRLVVIHASEALSAIARVARKKEYHTVVFILNGSTKLIQRLIKLTNMEFELVIGDTQQLKHHTESYGEIYELKEYLNSAKHEAVLADHIQ